MKKSKSIIGRIIKYRRKKLGLTMQELADRLEVDRQYVWKLENGKINMSLNYLDKVIDKLGYKHEDFFNETENF
jgi:transcriptional regulator with XRE-family HTH domain